jgi:methionine sulfoxide reductase heme-binding subunit
MAPTASTPPFFALWRDRTGSFSPVRAAALALAILPAAPLLWRIFAHDLGPRPLTEVSHVTGLWAVRLLAATLAVTPLMALTRQPRLAPARRILGVSVFFWMCAHLVAFFADKMFDPVVIAQEIVLRVYLIIGFAAFVMLAALAATSTDGAIKRLGAMRWKKLHLLVYPVAALGLGHFFMQAKLDISEPTVMAGIFGLLGLMRLPKRFGRPLTAPIALALTVVAAISVALIEAGWFAFHMGAPFGAVLMADFDLSLGLRPCWQVLIAGLAFVAIGVAVRAGAPTRPASRGARVRGGATSSAHPR